MSDLKESLVMMREMAKTRIQMLKEGVTLHSSDKKSFYLSEYEARVKELDHLIRRQTLKLVHSRQRPAAALEASLQDQLQ